MPACCVPAPTFCVLSLQVSFSGRHGPLRDLFVPSVASLDVCSVSLLLMQTGGKRSLHLSVLASGHVMSVFRRGNNLNIYYHVLFYFDPIVSYSFWSGLFVTLFAVVLPRFVNSVHKGSL